MTPCKSRRNSTLCMPLNMNMPPNLSLKFGIKMNKETLTTHLETIPLIKYDHLKNIPFFSFPAEWNAIDDLRFQTNKITFQIALKNNLISELSPVPPQPHPLSPTHPPHLSSVKFANKLLIQCPLKLPHLLRVFQDPWAPTIPVMYSQA